MSIFDRRRRVISSVDWRKDGEEPGDGPLMRWDLASGLSTRVEPLPGMTVIDVDHQRTPVTEPSNDRQVRFGVERPDAHLADAFRGREAGERVAALRSALDKALDQWWRANQLPSPALLRDGLLALEAGQSLSEAQRTLLLRAALLHRKGMITALRHQTDPERTASILKEAILNVKMPLTPDVLWRLQQEDEHGQIWAPLLLRELEDEQPRLQGFQQQLAVQALFVVQGNRPLSRTRLRPVAGAQGTTLATLERAYWSPGRWLILVLLAVAILTGVGLHLGRAPRMAMVSIPAGVYAIGDGEEAGSVRTVQLAAFDIDQTEVTNRQYSECVAAGECLPPASIASATRPDYFTNPAYASHPVVNVDWEGASRYCSWLAKRLPTAEEWEVAASAAPALQRSYRYPWGATFDSRLANTQAAGHGDTQAVGSYHPTGNSPFGLMDMAGNVAEWTSTPAMDGRDLQPGGYVVKGGSFRDAPADVQTHKQLSLQPHTVVDWLGFRCVSDSSH